MTPQGERVAGVSTDEVMALALSLSGLEEVPPDSAIHHPGAGIRRVLIGIDLEGPELLAARDLGYDLVIAHHPIGTGALGFPRVLERHVPQMVEAGVPEPLARAAIAALVEERRVAAGIANADRAPSLARLLRLPYMNIHTPLDEIGRRRMAEAVAALAPDATVADLVSHLGARFGEFRNTPVPIEVRVGLPGRHLGRTVVSHAAGTNGGYAVAKAYFDHGVDTMVLIHFAAADSARLRAEFGDRKALVVTGHLASDSIGINPFIDALRERGLEVTPTSGIVAP